ncbi:hypothetical protein [Streptomyces sp. NPDC059491]|uniref:hypothetical protein n=1 Tax=Streptomyces sp. NPDC059491 TaxID=3346850 RepID=UPI0036889BAC
MDSLGTLFAAGAWGVLLVCLVGAVVAAVVVTRWRRRVVSDLENAENERDQTTVVRAETG